MKVLICGDRKYNHPKIITFVLEGLLTFCIDSFEDLTVIEGCANGADNTAHHFYDGPCKEKHGVHDFVKHEHFPANWKALGRAAGPSRNEAMLKEGNPDFVFGFHDNIGESKGTADMLARAEAAGKEAYLISRFRR